VADIFDILVKAGYAVSIVQIPLTSLADDVAATKRALDLQQGPSLLVGHSYGGVVITEAGNAAMSPASSTSPLSSPTSARAPLAAVAGDRGQRRHARHERRFLYLDPAAFAADFAADVTPALAKFMAHSQPMLAKAAGGAPVTTAAWRHKKSWRWSPRTTTTSIPISSAPWPSERVAKRSRFRQPFGLRSKPNDVAGLIERAPRRRRRRPSIRHSVGFAQSVCEADIPLRPAPA